MSGAERFEERVTSRILGYYFDMVYASRKIGCLDDHAGGVILHKIRRCFCTRPGSGLYEAEAVVRAGPLYLYLVPAHGEYAIRGERVVDGLGGNVQHVADEGFGLGCSLEFHDDVLQEFLHALALLEGKIDLVLLRVDGAFRGLKCTSARGMYGIIAVVHGEAVGKLVHDFGVVEFDGFEHGLVVQLGPTAGGRGGADSFLWRASLLLYTGDILALYMRKIIGI